MTVAHRFKAHARSIAIREFIPADSKARLSAVTVELRAAKVPRADSKSLDGW